MESTVFDYGMNGEGVTKIDDVITLVPYSLKDEKIDVEIVSSFGNYNIGKCNKILTESDKRIKPACPCFSVCGGCDLQHMNYDEQLYFKSLLIKKTIKKIANLDVEVNPTIESNQIFNYRNKVSFNISNNKIGFFKQNSKEIVEIDNCMLTSENINKILKIFKNYAKNTQNSLNFIKNLVIREIFGQILVGVVCVKEIDLSTFYSLLCEEFSCIGLYQIINTRKDSVVLSGKTIHIGGIKEINISNFNINYSVDLLGFHQTNIDIQNKLYQKVLDNITTNDVVINGFSGQGLLSAIIAQKAKKVIGIEINKSSHLSAEKLKKDNNILNMQNVLGDFNKEIKKYLKNVNTLILDPAKKGCGKDILTNIIGVKNIIYISCNPIALSKDLNILKPYYKIEEITPFDMFPNTKNVETFVKLSKI